MKSSLNQNSAFKTPLTEVLGSKGHIQVLRQMVMLKSSTSTAELLRRTEISRQGVYDVVGRLVKTGILKYVGSGKRQQIQLNTDHPMALPITNLFEAENDRFNSFIKKLKKEIEDLESPPKSAWIYGKVANGTDEYGDPVRIALLGEINSVDDMTDRFRQKLYKANIEKKYDVTLEVRGVTLADREVMNMHPVIILWGVDPQFYLVSSKDERGQNKSHQALDKRSLNDADLWVDFLKAHPEVIERTKAYLKDKIQTEESGVRNELMEWYRLLESMSFQRFKKFLQSDSERSTRMRQSLPFWPVLTEAERKEFKSMAEE